MAFLLPILLSMSLLRHFIIQGCADVEMVSRDRWGARLSLDNTTNSMPVPHLFIHHTVTPQCNDLISCSRRMRGMQNYHMDDLGWDDIGYNFLIGGDGRVYVARGWTRMGAHTYGFNRNSIAFSLIGDFTEQPPSEIMLNATRSLIRCAEDQGYVAENYKLHGHRDAGCTECPGSALYALIKEWPRFEAGPLPGYRCL
ncbi:peptidoglycan-recognition protein 1-like [Stegodyphus dumicola]|uniref:peptidoglycan-recognition protein 1-like n=1 Tax=Stegodyphus dumicola TaxID=202533 RepID=UPI0015AB24A2|nr:peptidoglycan-recognition protein 1-like [Stegodyphus dumicola]